MADLKRMRWDTINSTFHKGVLKEWKSEGCYDTIAKSLGYRLVMTSANCRMRSNLEVIFLEPSTSPMWGGGRFTIPATVN